LQAKFEDEVKSNRVYKTPGTPRFKIVFLKIMMASLKQICRVDTVLDSE
jgi:hypothetical protein